MRVILLLISWVSWVLMGLLLGSCSSAPKPPTVDESNRRPANSAMAIELQACKSDLHNTQIAARATLPKVKIYDKAAPSQRPAITPTPAMQRPRERAAPAR